MDSPVSNYVRSKGACFQRLRSLNSAIYLPRAFLPTLVSMHGILRKLSATVEFHLGRISQKNLVNYVSSVPYSVLLYYR